MADAPSDTEIELIQFPMSHFNEKARWALDLKQVPHIRTSLLPGPHAGPVKKLTGQTMVPVVRFGDSCVAGSAEIMDELEKRFPEPTLYPADPAQKARALEIQNWFDDEIGPKVRRSLFVAMMEAPTYIVKLFAGHRSPPVRALYRASFPLAAGMMKKSMDLTEDAAVEAGRATDEGLDFVAKEAGPDGYLVGESFSIADLAAAALLAPAANPPDSPMAQPLPKPKPVADWSARWADKPGTEWVHDMYRRHRPKSQHPR